MGTLSYNERQERPFLRAGGRVSAGGLMQRGERVGVNAGKGRRCAPTLSLDRRARRGGQRGIPLLMY